VADVRSKKGPYHNIYSNTRRTRLFIETDGKEQTMRLIDADMVLTRIHESSSRALNGQAKTACDRIVRNTPTANVEMVENWVPVTECLPEDEETVNFTFVAEGIPYVGTGYVKGGRWYHDHGSPVLERVLSWRENRKARLAPRWIPCSERLPEQEGRYLCTNSCWGKWAVDINMWTEDGWLYAGNEPIAWMELPEPYEEEQD